MRKSLLILVSLIATLVVAPAASAAVTKNVSIKRASFVPATVNITAGDTIRWKNDDTRNHQVVSTTGTFASPVLAPRQDVLVQVRRRRHLPVPRRARPGQHRHDQGRGRTAGGHARHVAAADLLRHAGHALRPDQQQEGRRERPAQLPAVRAGLRGRPRDGDHRRRRRLQLQRDAEDPHHLPRCLEDRVEPSRPDGGRTVDLVRPDERLRHPRLRGAEHGPQAGAAAAPLAASASG